MQSSNNNVGEKYLSDDSTTINVIENLIKLCEFTINFNKLPIDDAELQSSLKLAIENNTIPLTYISNGYADKILRFVKFEVNELISNKSS